MNWNSLSKWFRISLLFLITSSSATLRAEATSPSCCSLLSMAVLQPKRDISYTQMKKTESGRNKSTKCNQPNKCIHLDNMFAAHHISRCICLLHLLTGSINSVHTEKLNSNRRMKSLKWHKHHIGRKQQWRLCLGTNHCWRRSSMRQCFAAEKPEPSFESCCACIEKSSHFLLASVVTPSTDDTCSSKNALFSKAASLSAMSLPLT